MTLWPFGRRRAETRSSGYAATLINAAGAAAAGAGGDVASATAAVEAAAGLWSRVLALAIVHPVNRRTAAITSSLLALVGRELAAHGEAIFDIRVAGGAVRLIPASPTFTVTGADDPATWDYLLTTYGPTGGRSYSRPRDAVLHLQYGTTAAAPWRGVAPWAGASLSGRLLAGVERQLSGEARSSSGYLLAVPDTGDRGAAGADDDGSTDPLASLRADMAAGAGRTLLAPATAAGYGGGAGVAPASEYKASRWGINPPLSTVELRRDVAREIAGCFGVPPVLLDAKAPGAALREGWRFFVGTAAIPLADAGRLAARGGSRGTGVAARHAAGAGRPSGRCRPSPRPEAGRRRGRDVRPGPRGCRSLTSGRGGVAAPPATTGAVSRG